MSEVTNPAGLSHNNPLSTAPISLPAPATTAAGEAIDSKSLLMTIFHSPDLSEPLVVPSSAHSLDGFCQWALSDEFPDYGRIAFIEGRLVVDMSPEAFEEHAVVKSEICRVLLNLVHGRKLGRFLLDGFLYTNASAGVSNEPDALFVRTGTFRSGKAKLTPVKDHPQSYKEITGSVDWTLEIVSPSSVNKDTQWLREAYFRAGVGEYWLVDAYGEDIGFQILVASKNGYIPVDSKKGWLASPTFGSSFRLTREKDEDGYWQYTLDMQEKQ